jgi:hypothetical protein
MLPARNGLQRKRPLLAYTRLQKMEDDSLGDPFVMDVYLNSQFRVLSLDNGQDGASYQVLV